MRLKTILLVLLALLIPICLANPLPYWIEDFSGNYTIWTKINISAGGTVYLYITKEPGYAPNGNAVFLFFDDFNDGNWQDNWEVVRGQPGTEIYIDNGKLVLDGNGPTQDGITVCTKKELDLPNKIRIEAKVYAYDWNEWVGFVISPDLKTNPSNYYGWVDGYGFGWWGWGGTQHSMRTWSGGNSIVNDHSAYPGFFSAKDNTYYFIGGAYNGTTLFHYKPSTTDTISYDHQRDDTKYSNQTWKRIFLMVWDNAKWGYDWIRVRKYADKDPIVSVKQISTNVWEVKITNPNDYALTNFQVAIPGNGIVSSKTASLYIGVVPYAKIDYYKSLSGYTLTVSGDLGNVSLYLGSALLYSGAITSGHPFQTSFPYDVSAYPLNIVYHNYDNVSITYQISSITQGTYTLNLVPVGDYKNESYYPMIITVSGKSYWISNYSNIPMNISVSTYENNPILITSSLGQEISVPAKNQKVPIYFTTSWSSVKASTTPGHVLKFETQNGYIVGYGQIVNIKIPTGLTLTPYLDGFKLNPFTVSQNLNLFYSPTDLLPQIDVYQTITGDIIISIKSLQPHNFTALFYHNNTIVKNISLFPGTFTYPNENYTKIVIYVDGKEYDTMKLYPITPLKNWDSLDFPEKVLLSIFLLGIIGIIYLVSGITMVLAAGIVIPILILLPLPTSLIGFISAFMLLSALFYLYKRRV